MSGSESSSNILNSGLNYALSIRIDRPVAGCEIAPHPYLTIKGGVMDNNTRAKLMEANPHDFVFRWSRGPRRPVCAHINCPRGNSFDPVHWSRFACGGPALRCAVCERAKASKLDSLFCSVSCFKGAWQHHSQQMHISPILDKSSKRPSSKSEDTNPIDLIDAQPQQDDSDKDMWIEISNDKTYAPSNDDVGCVLRVEVRALAIGDGSLLAGPILVFTEPVLASPRPPPKKSLITVPGALAGASSSVRFRVISYNILAELYATKQAYPYSDSWSLSWPFRRKLIQDELEDAQGDIVCLQEMQADHFEQVINPFMQQLGYEGLFKQKSRESMGQYGKVDGCATFWKRNKFTITESYTIELNECARRAASNLNLDETDARRYINRLSKDNIAQVVFLEAQQARQLQPATLGRPTRTLLCVANTHLYSNQMRPDVKLWQCCTLLHEIEQLVAPREIPLLICGDFNSEPDSAVYEFLSEGMIERPHPEVQESDTLHVLPELRNIGHNLDLSSAMSTALGMEPMFTNYTANFKGCLDYIWYSPARLRVMAVMGLPDETTILSECGEGLPATNYPSDHLMLCCDVALSLPGTTGGSITRNPALVQSRSNGNNSYMSQNFGSQSQGTQGSGRERLGGSSAGMRRTTSNSSQS